MSLKFVTWERVKKMTRTKMYLRKGIFIYIKFFKFSAIIKLSQIIGSEDLVTSIVDNIVEKVNICKWLLKQ